MASGKTDNLMTAILAHGKDPVTGEYLTAKQRKELFKKAKVSGSKVFGGSGGGGSFRGGGGGGGGRSGGLAGGALVVRDPGAIATNDVNQKLGDILTLLKTDAETETKYREEQFEKQRRVREKLVRGSAEQKLEGADKPKAQKVEKAKKGMQVQIPFLERLAKFLMIYLAGWTSDKLINMFSAQAAGNVEEFTKYRDTLINSLGRFFAPVANIANGFAFWVANAIKTITRFSLRIGRKIFTPFFKKIRDLAIGMLNKFKGIVQKPVQQLTESVVKPIAEKTVKPLAQAVRGLLPKGKKPPTSTPTDLGPSGPKGYYDTAVKESTKKGGKKGLISKLTGFVSDKLLKRGSNSIGKLLKNIIGESLLGTVLASFFTVRNRFGSGQSPTQAILGGLLEGLGEGVFSGSLTAALSALIPGAGFWIGLAASGFLGPMVGKAVVKPFDDWFNSKKQPENEFDKWFSAWMDKQSSTVKALASWDARTPQSGPATNIKSPEAQNDGAGTGKVTRVSPGGAVNNNSVLTPIRNGGGRTSPVVIPIPMGSPRPPQQVPNKQLVTDLPSIESTNYDNPYLVFSYSIYNVLV